MKKQQKERALRLKYAEAVVHRDEVEDRRVFAALHPVQDVYAQLGTSAAGLDETEAGNARARYGTNAVTRGKKASLAARLRDAFFDPFTLVLLALAAVSLFTDVITAAPGERDPATVLIIAAMVMISGTLRFVQNTRSGNAAARLGEMIRTTACVERRGAGARELPLAEVVVGDIVQLSAGDMLPADVRIVSAKDLFVSQSALTGESEPVEKLAVPYAGKLARSADAPNLAFMGSTVVSGSAAALVLAVGDDTLLGDMARHLSEKPAKSAFEKGVSSVSWVLIRFMLVMVPAVFLINGFTKGDWLHAALFAISVAVGLTPEMLPMIVTTCLAKGAVAMSKEKVIIKNLNAIQNLGAIDVLCTDKTGTLTQDRVVLEYHLDVTGRENDRVLRHAFLNSYFQTGLKNLMDLAVIDRARALAAADPAAADIERRYRKVDEVPFDFERRRMSVVVADETGKTQLITKGAIEEMLSVCSHVEYEGAVVPLTDALKALALEKVDALNADGMRVLGVAQKSNPAPVGAFSAADESDMVLIGYLAFLDPPKETTAAAIRALRDSGVAAKILTGDNEKVTQCICRKVGLPVENVLLGEQLAGMDDAALRSVCEKTTIFAKLSPTQKAQVVTALRENGHTVGYMGDGINDAAAMKAADVGISVDTAVDVAREAAGVILLEKDLLVLEKGIREGRRTYVNTIKYIKMTAASNFGNMLSVLAASAFLPFLPMQALQLLALNLVYDISCTAIPWDHVDAELLGRPCRWEAGTIGRFMLRIGPSSSVFDILTYLLLYFVLCPAVCGGRWGSLDAAGQALFISVFHTGWFVESMWSQTLVIHMLRTPKIPFVQSRASGQLMLLSAAGIALMTALPYTPAAAALGLHALPPVYFGYLAAILAGYMILVNLSKKWYIRRYGSLL
jgi:Mg2+-importing ATPase